MNELENIQSLKAENKEHLQHKIENLFKDYVNQQNEEPLYALCDVQFLDDSDSMNVTIKLNSGADEMDDDIFYYCNSLSDLKSLCDFGVSDFVLTNVYEFSNEI